MDAERNGTATLDAPVRRRSPVLDGLVATTERRQAPPRRRRGLRRFVGPASLGLALLGPLLGAVAYRVADGYADERRQDAFHDVVADRARAFDAEVVTLIEALHSCRGFYDSSAYVTRAEFATYTHETRARHPGILAMGWAPRIARHGRDAHERRGRGEGMPAYRLTARGVDGSLDAAPPRDEHFPVLYAEPVDSNQETLGFDLASDAVLRQAVTAAVASGEVVMSGPVALVQQGTSATGAILALCVYAAADKAKRPRGQALGVLTVTFRFDVLARRLAESAPDASAPRVALELFDVTAGGRESLFRGDGTEVAGRDAPFVADRPLVEARREWTLMGIPTPRFLAERRGPSPILIALGVVLLWELLAAFVVVLARSWRSEALEREARLVESVLKSLDEGVVVADGNGRVRLANDAARRLVAADPKGLAATDWSARAGFLMPDGATLRPPDRLPLLRAMRGESVDEEETSVRSSTASGIWMSLTARPLVEDGARAGGGVMVMRDITARKKYEESLSRLSSAVEQTADAVWIGDRNGRFLYVNPAFESMTGWSREEAVGASVRMLVAEGVDAIEFEQAWAGLARGEVYRTAATRRRKSGTSYPVEETITPMRDAAGRVTHVVAVSKDMSERLRLQERDMEMHVASMVQQRLYPPAPPIDVGLDLAGAVFSADATCGDYYDFLVRSDGSVCIAVGDVSGHGLGPALVMAETRAYLRSLWDAGLSPGEILRRIDQLLSKDLGGELFVTLLLAVVDPRTGALSFANAGHVPGMVVGGDGVLAQTMPATGPPLGMALGSVYEDRVCGCLGRDDVLALVTDGATEAPSPDGALFDDTGVVEVVVSHRGESAASILRALREATLRFSLGRCSRDDVTIVVCKRERVAPVSAS